MKTLSIYCLILLFAGLVSCTVFSVHPLYTSESIIMDDRLIGTWKEADEPNTYVEITLFQDSSYYLVYSEKEDTLKFESHYLKIGNDFYLDLYPDKDEIPVLMMKNYFPVHSFQKIIFSGQQMLVYMFDGKKMIELFKQNRIRLQHELLDDCVLITARTEDIQKFIQKYSSDTASFLDPAKFDRIKK